MIHFPYAAICQVLLFKPKVNPMTAKGNYQTTPLGIAEALNDVAEFHRTFGHPIVEHPTIPPPDRQVLRSSLIRDEYLREFDPAWARCARLQHPSSPDSNNPDAHADALSDMADVICDLIYYLLGTALEYGLPLEEVWQEVQKSNMAKLWTTREIDTVGHQPGWRYERRVGGDYHRNPDERAYVAFDETGKVRKPPSWKEPDVKGIIRRAMERRPDTVTASNEELAR